MAGLYLHIPFCRRRCHYCDFYFTTNQTLVDDFISALTLEIDSKKHLLQGLPIQTIYFGGGTPSLLSPTQLSKILQALNQAFETSKVAEITLEMNPEDYTKTYVRSLKGLGINRISLGIQSFEEPKLKLLSREHSAKQAFLSLEGTLEEIPNVSIDLIFGTENETLDHWNHELQTILSYHPKHISAYSLTVEPKTLLAKLISRRLRKAPKEEVQREMFLQTISTLSTEGYHHYEVSNYGLAGFYSKHNRAYWERIPYLGFGPSAHSYFTMDTSNGRAEIRASNQASLLSYLKSPSDSIDLSETLLPVDIFNEKILLGLRQSKGIEKAIFNSPILMGLGEQIQLEILQTLSRFISAGFMKENETHFVLSSEGLALADSIAEEFFLELPIPENSEINTSLST
ncbi:MAG: radical SAM family heme chaperone HemW [Chloroherpetonaceae bacterium]|nr:radical SAM family heme chaperone HemW [Chloroherpetonaceae bacterium]